MPQNSLQHVCQWLGSFLIPWFLHQLWTDRVVITTQQNSCLGKCWKQFWATSESWSNLVYCFFLWHLVQCWSTFHKKVNITGLGWMGNVKYIIDRKKKSQSISHGGSSTQCDEIFSLCGYAERIQGPKFPRTYSSWKCSLVDTLVKWLFFLKGKQTNKQNSTCNNLQCNNILMGPQQSSNSPFYNLLIQATTMLFENTVPSC